MSFLYGILLGLCTLIFIGPVFFTLLDATWKAGKRGGMQVVFGVLAGDVICATLSYLVNERALADGPNLTVYYKWIALSGSMVLILMAHKYWNTTVQPDTKKTRQKSFFGIGFVINFLNPFVFMVWFSFGLLLKQKYPSGLLLGLIGVLTGIFLMDVVKVLLAQQLKPLVKQKKLELIYKSMAVCMLLFAVRLAWYFVSNCY